MDLISQSRINTNREAVVQGSRLGVQRAFVMNYRGRWVAATCEPSVKIVNLLKGVAFVLVFDGYYRARQTPNLKRSTTT